MILALVVILVLLLIAAGFSCWLAVAAIKAIDDDDYVTPASAGRRRTDRTD